MKTKKIFRGTKRYLYPILFTLLSIYLIMVILKTPYIGIDVEQTEGGQWEVSHVDKHSWAANQGIKEGSIVLSVNMQKPADYSTIKTYEKVEKADSLTLRPFDGKEMEQLSYSRIEDEVSLDQWLFYIIFPSSFMLIMLLLSLFILFHKKHDESGNRLILFFLTVGLAYLSASGSARGDMISTLVSTVTLLMGPALLLHFVDSYFRDLQSRWYASGVYNWMKIGACAVVTYEAYCLVNGYYPDWYPQFISILFIAFTCIALSLIVVGYKRYKQTVYAPILKYMLVGLFVSFTPFILLFMLPNYLFGFQILSGEASALFLMVMPLTFIYLITAKRLLDIDFVMGRIRYYAYSSFIPTVLIVALVGFAIDFPFSIQDLIQLGIGILIIMIAFLYVKEIFNFQIQRNLFSEKKNYHQSLQRFVHEMKKERDAVGLFKRLKRELLDVLDLKEVYIFSQNTISNYYCLYQEVPLSLMNECVERSKTVLGDVGNLVKLQDHEGYVLVIGHTVSKVTYLYISEKPNRTQLNLDERGYLQTISYNTNIAHENLLLIEDLFQELQHVKNDRQQNYPAWLSRLLFSLAENERQQIAIDLHDTVLQEQLYLYRQMDDFVNRKRSMEPDVKKQMFSFKEQLLDNIHLIRETCNELRPPFLEELGLIPSLQNLINQYQLRSNYTVTFDSRAFQIELNSQYVLGIYRIVQELLTNAMKHSRADKVFIMLYREGSDVRLVYEDNGVGINPNKRIETYSHMGISGIEQRVNGLNGEISIQSAPKQGFQMYITFFNAANHEGEELYD
ncbi:sensor histidine kinase [Pontibacillus salipaludis]|uniref:histidine kinase n=1 Tax=Pontibacillus salipaludis TaxID=1697394 RepID=A0ABQ1PT11_9BACI|nr:ATP-binding protein [Pontibacillus salipaludis]GGD03215.1 ATPase [Pontibacillus salipaludis]